MEHVILTLRPCSGCGGNRRQHPQYLWDDGLALFNARIAFIGNFPVYGSSSFRIGGTS